MNKSKLLLLTAAVGLCSLPAVAQRDFLPPTMGWSSWNTFAAEISDEIICGQADAMVDKGFAEAGYNYVNIDDGFFANRDPKTGRLIIHPTRFPRGLRPVVDYIHSKGLKAGTYSDAGHNTCASYWGTEKGGIGAGLYEHDEQDLKMYFDEMDFDFIKVDFCGGCSHDNAEGLDLDPQDRYTTVRRVLDSLDKKGIVYNVCRWNFPGTWVMDIADSYRTTQDIEDNWASISDIIKQNLYLSAYCRGGHYNDLDMLEVGRSMTPDEDVTHFAIWCIMSSPLLIGCDLRSVDDATRRLLTNPEMIAVNQDPLGLQAYVAKVSNGAYVLVKDIETLGGNRRAVAIYNPADTAVTATFDFADVDLGGNVAVRDLYHRANLGDFTESYTVALAPHATQMLMLDAEKRLMRTVYEAETAYLSKYQELVNPTAFGNAIYEPMAEASGAMVVTGLGGGADNDLLWRDVMVPEDGDYDITIEFFSGDNRDMNIDINGSQPMAFVWNSGGDNQLGSCTIRVKLNKGANTVRLYNDHSTAPVIDRMTISKGQCQKSCNYKCNH